MRLYQSIVIDSETIITEMPIELSMLKRKSDEALTCESHKLLKKSELQHTSGFNPISSLNENSSNEIISPWCFHITDIIFELKIFCQFIPCRANNSIVDESFEDDMNQISSNFGDWEIFANYLR